MNEAKMPAFYKKLFAHKEWIYLLMAYILPFVGSSVFLMALSAFEPKMHAPASFMIYFVATTLLLIPGMVSSTVVAFAAGFLFGLESVAGLLPSYFVASWMGYYLASGILGKQLIDSLTHNPRFVQFKNKAEGGGWFFAAMSRMSPALPFPAANLAFACLQFPLASYLGGSMVGMLPRTAAAVYFGNQAQSYASTGQTPELRTLSFVLLGITGIYFYSLIVKKSSVAN